MYRSECLGYTHYNGVRAGQFLTAVADNPKARLSVENNELISHLQVFEPSSWPSNKNPFVPPLPFPGDIWDRVAVDECPECYPI